MDLFECWLHALENGGFSFYGYDSLGKRWTVYLHSSTDETYTREDGLVIKNDEPDVKLWYAE